MQNDEAFEDMELENSGPVQTGLKRRASTNSVTVERLEKAIKSFRQEQDRFEDELFRQVSGTGLLLSSVVQGSESWRRSRTNRITASDFGVVVGVSDFANRQDLWKSMTGRVGDPFKGNEDTQRGHDLEPEAIEWYKMNILERRNEKHEVRATGLWIHKKSFIGASPDGLVGENGLVEVKCPRNRPHLAIPPAYMAQIQGQLNITNREWCDFVSYHRCEDVNVFRVYRSQEYWDWMYPQLENFFLNVEMDVEPELLEFEERQRRYCSSMQMCNFEKIFVNRILFATDLNSFGRGGEPEQTQSCQ